MKTFVLAAAAAVAISASPAPAAVLYQSVPDFNASVRNASLCSQCFGTGYNAGQHFTLKSGGVADSLTFVVDSWRHWPTPVTVDLFKNAGDHLGTNVYHQTFSTFASDTATDHTTDIVSVNLGALNLAAGTYDLFLWNPENLDLSFFAGKPGGEGAIHVNSLGGPYEGAAFEYAFEGAPISVGIQLTGTVAGVPEPAIWGMMLVGFGLIGCAMRSRRQAAVA